MFGAQDACNKIHDVGQYGQNGENGQCADSRKGEVFSPSRQDEPGIEYGGARNAGLLAVQAAAVIVEVNLEETQLTRYISNWILKGSASEVMSRVVGAVNGSALPGRSRLEKRFDFSGKYPTIKGEGIPVPALLPEENRF